MKSLNQTSFDRRRQDSLLEMYAWILYIVRYLDGGFMELLQKTII